MTNNEDQIFENACISYETCTNSAKRSSSQPLDFDNVENDTGDNNKVCFEEDMTNDEDQIFEDEIVTNSNQPLDSDNVKKYCTGYSDKVCFRERNIPNDDSLNVDFELPILSLNQETIILPISDFSSTSASGILNQISDCNIISSEIVPNINNTNLDLPFDMDFVENSCSSSDDDIMLTLPLNYKKKVKNIKSKNQLRRFCVFCKTSKSRLTIHFKRCHKNLPEIKKILAKPHCEQVKSFMELRRKGIFEENLLKIKNDKDSSIISDKRLRSSKSLPILCGNCNSFYSNTYIRRHQLKCHQGKLKSFNSVFSLSQTMELSFITNILNNLRNDEIGKCCLNDQYILEIGKWLWGKQKHKIDKIMGTKNSVRRDMRQLAQLNIELLKVEDEIGALPIKYNDIRNLYCRKNLKHIFQALTNLSYNIDGKFKPGFKINTKYLLLKTANIMKTIYQLNDSDMEANDIEKFIDLLKVTEGDIFGDAVYQLNKNRNTNLRKPQNIPLEDDVKKLKEYMVSIMNKLNKLSQLSNKDFTLLRDIVVCRLTIFNARRGGEPCRLFIKDWTDAKNKTWISEANSFNLQLKENEKELLKKICLTYQTGKGNNHLVPIIFPQDTFKSIEILCSEEVREAHNIPKQNTYAFPTLQGNDHHVQGWYCVDRICSQADLKRKDLMTATKNRHRISSLFALMDIDPVDQKFLFKHLGHSAIINENVYQSPAVLKELSIVGQRLIELDGETPDMVSDDETLINNLEHFSSEDDETSIDNPAFVLSEDDDFISPKKLKPLVSPESKKKN